MEYWVVTNGGRNGRFAEVPPRRGGGRVNVLLSRAIPIAGAVAFAVSNKVGISFNGLIGILASTLLALLRMR